MTVIDKYLKHLNDQPPVLKPKFTAEEIKHAWQGIGLHLNTGYVVDMVSSDIVKAVFSNEKGCVFSGPKGIGKSLNMDILHYFMRDLMKFNVECWECNELESAFRISGDSVLDRAAKADILILNEIGLESAVLNDFGTNRNIVAELLYLRYRAYQVGKKRTYVTGNIKQEGLSKRYGDRLADRMKEMFVFVELTGESRRK